MATATAPSNALAKHAADPINQKLTAADKIELWGEDESLNILISNPLPEVRKQNHTRGNRPAR